MRDLFRQVVEGEGHGGVEGGLRGLERGHGRGCDGARAAHRLLRAVFGAFARGHHLQFLRIGVPTLLQRTVAGDAFLAILGANGLWSDGRGESVGPGLVRAGRRALVGQDRHGRGRHRFPAVFRHQKD